MEGFHQKYSDIKRADDARNSFIAELLQKITDLNKMMDRSSFVLVLIDGDCMNFRDDLIIRGIEGGDEAAKRLRNAIFDELRYEPDFKHDEKILIRVYANLRGLSKVYVDHNILRNTDSFSQFVLGFNKAHPLNDFIDAGNHKEAADKKLQENLNLYIRNVHCTHIIFGGSGDSSYASFLNSFDGVDVPSRVRLLKGPPFPFEFNTIFPRFKQVVFEDVFRTRAIGTAAKRRFVSEPEDYRDRRSEDVGPSKTRSVVAHSSSGPQQSTYKNDQNGPLLPNDQVRASITSNSDSHVHHSSNDLSFVEPTNESATTDRLIADRNISSHSPADIEVSLIIATNQLLIQNPKALDFGTVKQRVENKLGLPSNIWTDTSDNRWNDRSKDIIKWAVEEWVQRTNNPPPKNATWALKHFPEGIPPSVVMKDNKSLSWRMKGNPEWTGYIDDVITQVYRNMVEVPFHLEHSTMTG